MGHIAYLRKQFKSINTWLYHNVDQEKKKPIIYFMRIEWFFIFFISSSLFGWNWLSGSWEKISLNFVNVFLLFCYYLPLEKDAVLYLNKLESPSPKDALCQVWLKLAQWFLKKDFKFLQCIFSISLLSTFWKLCGPSFQAWIPFT